MTRQQQGRGHQREQYSDSDEQGASSDNASANAGSSPEVSDDDEQASMSSHGEKKADPRLIEMASTKNNQNQSMSRTKESIQTSQRGQKTTQVAAGNKKKQRYANSSEESGESDSDQNHPSQIGKSNLKTQSSSQQQKKKAVGFSQENNNDGQVRKRDTTQNQQQQQQNGGESDSYRSDNSDEFSDFEDDYEYNSEGEYVRKPDRPKKEHYDFTETLLKWIGFFVVVLFMWGIYYLMLRKGVGSTTASQRAAKHKESRTISLDQPTSYPFDIEFKNEDYRTIKDTDDRIKSVQCTDEHPIYAFTYPAIAPQQSEKLHMKSFLDLKCTQCNSARMVEGSNANHTFKDSISYEQIAEKFRCNQKQQSSEVSKVYRSDSCEVCDEDCHKCTPFSHHCYSCYNGYVLASKQRCEKKCEFDGESVVEHFCVKQREGLNLTVAVVSGEDPNFFLLHTPPLIDVESSAEAENDSEPVELPDEMKPISGDSLGEDKGKTVTPKVVDKRKKYPMIVLLNDYRHSQQDVFKGKSIGRYLDKAFVLSVPFLNSLPDSKELHKIILKAIKALMNPAIEGAIGAYGLVGIGLTGQLTNEISLNQQDDSNYWQARFMVSTAISDTHFTTIVSQNSHVFDQTIKAKDNYFKEQLFCRLDSRQKQVKSVSGGDQSIFEHSDEDLLDFYIKKSFDEILHHYENKRVSLNGF